MTTNDTTPVTELEKLRGDLAQVRAQRDWLLKHVDYDTRNRYHRIQDAQNARAAQRTDKPACNCCYVDGSTQQCGQTATTTIDVPPFGYLDVSETCRDRINGAEVAR